MSSHAPRSVKPSIEQLETRLNPSHTFSAGVLIITADVQQSRDVVRVTAAGAASDGSTGVQVRSNLVNNGAPTTFGGAGNPVDRITLDLKDGNDGVWVDGLAQTRIRVGEGNGNNIIVVGDSEDIGVAAGNGNNLVTVGRGLENTAGGLVPGNTVVAAGAAILLGWSYTVDTTTGGLFTPIAPIGNNRGSNVVLVDDDAGDKAIVDIASRGYNLVSTGAGDDVVWIQGNSSNLIDANGGKNQIQVDGNGNNAIDAGNNQLSSVVLNFTGQGGYNYVAAANGSSVKVNNVNVASSGRVDGTNTFVRFKP